MIQLRPYQEDAVAAIRRAFGERRRRVLFVLPTGGGKTTIFSHITHSVAGRGKRVCVLVHRQELVDQVSGALAAVGVAHGIIAGGRPETDEPVQVASVASLGRRLDRVQAFDLLVPDEAHHAVAGSWRAILDAMPRAFVLGVTATPERLDGRGLGDAFDVMVQGPTVADLMAAGFLVPATVYAPAEPVDLSSIRTERGDYAPGALAEAMSSGSLVGNAVEHYGRLSKGVPAIAFCAGIEHSRMVASRFIAAGFRAAHVDGTTDRDERRAMIAALGSGGLDVLTNAGLISEGVDVPTVGAAILLRPTQSLGLYLQQVGRALRTAPGKTRALILDHAGNSLRHGLPDEVREWSLAAKPRRSREPARAVGPRRCPECDAVNPTEALVCEVCGAELRRSAEEVREIEARLIEAERVAIHARIRAMSYGEAIRWADTEDKLRQVAKARRYHHGWVHHQLAALADRAAA